MILGKVKYREKTMKIKRRQALGQSCLARSAEGMMMMRPLASSGFLLFFLANMAYAEALEERVLESNRYYARGNTFVAATDSDEATRGNPATLAEAKVSFQLRWEALDLMVGENTVDSLSDVMSIDAEGSAVKLLQTFRDKFGKRQYLRAQLAPLNMRIYSFELTPFAVTTNFVDMRLPTTPEIKFYSDSLAGLGLSYAFALGKEFLVGTTIKPTYHSRFSGDVAFADLLDFVDNSDFSLEDVFNHEEDYVVAADVGLIWVPSKEWRFGLVGENLGFADDAGGFKDPPPALRQRLSLGMDYRADYKPWYWDVLVDFQDILAAGDTDIFRLLHVGTELGRTYFTRDTDLGIACGINEGYFTSGAYVDLYLVRLQLTYYAVELGEYAGQRKDRRYGLTIASAMTF